MAFSPSRVGQDLWVRKLDDYEGYNFITTHVDDIIIAARHLTKYMNHIEHNFQGKYLHLSTKKYVKKVLRRCQEKYGTLVTENLLLKPKSKPELDDSPLLEEKEHKEYQHIIGVC
eukprot:11084144-Ditylum_brightwellii.AAC.1